MAAMLSERIISPALPGFDITGPPLLADPLVLHEGLTGYMCSKGYNLPLERCPEEKYGTRKGYRGMPPAHV